MDTTTTQKKPTMMLRALQPRRRILGDRPSRVKNVLLVLFLSFVYLVTRAHNDDGDGGGGAHDDFFPDSLHHRQWRSFPERYPVEEHHALPTGSPATTIPRIQAAQPLQAAAILRERLARRDAVKESFIHAWTGYRSHAWLRDELRPVSGRWADPFGGWAATLVDGLDTLWLLGLHDEFDEAVAATAAIDFYNTPRTGGGGGGGSISVFETTIRYMGGLLGAYDVSGQAYPALLQKAVELGGMIMGAFDTPNRWPITTWDIEAYLTGAAQESPTSQVLADPCSLSLELTRLSQETGDLRFYDAAQRILDGMEAAQNSTQLPGMWPLMLNARDMHFGSHNLFSLGAMADSAFEYLPKLYLALNGATDQTRRMYEEAIEVAKKHIFLRVLNPDNLRIRIAGDAVVQADDAHGGAPTVSHQPLFQHLGCFTGGMVALGAQIFDRPEDLVLAEELTHGCIWAYNQSANGIAPERFDFVACDADEDVDACMWSDARWHDAIAAAHGIDEAVPLDQAAQIAKTIAQQRLPKGFVAIGDRRYQLRPEAIESVFILHRITGSQVYADAAWSMFEAVTRATRTAYGASSVVDVTVPVNATAGEQQQQQQRLELADVMESFYLAETLKYFYLIFDAFDVVSLDEYVLNTEAHPLRWGEGQELAARRRRKAKERRRSARRHQ